MIHTCWSAHWGAGGIHLAVVLAGSFIAVLDTTIVNVALPQYRARSARELRRP